MTLYHTGLFWGIKGEKGECVYPQFTVQNADARKKRLLIYCSRLLLNLFTA